MALSRQISTESDLACLANDLQTERRGSYGLSMGESQYLSVIRIWAALAWADDKIVDAEAAAMKRLVESADLTAEERKTALGWLDTKVELDTAGIAGLSDDARQGIYRAAGRLAAVDLEIADEERAFLDRLRDGLKIDEETARELEKGVPMLTKDE